MRIRSLLTGIALAAMALMVVPIVGGDNVSSPAYASMKNCPAGSELPKAFKSKDPGAQLFSAIFLFPVMAVATVASAPFAIVDEGQGALTGHRVGFKNVTESAGCMAIRAGRRSITFK